MKPAEPSCKSLFSPSGSPSDAVLNWFGEPNEKFGAYAEAYRLAARRLLEKSSHGELRDIGACPVVFLYRHSLELYLKEILICGQKLLHHQCKSIQSQDDILKSGHNLSKLCDAIKDLHNQIGFEWELELEGCMAKIKEFDRQDPQSISFRYPLSKNGSAALEESFQFDLRHFSDRMEVVLEKLDAISFGIAGVFDQTNSLHDYSAVES